VQAEDEPWEFATVKEELKEEAATAEYGVATKRLGHSYCLRWNMTDFLWILVLAEKFRSHIFFFSLPINK
jgi:hypothetical protein